jgi:hypothetical protein
MFIDAAERAPMPGPRGPSMKRFLLAVAEIALRSGQCNSIPLSERSLSESSGLDRSTVRKYLSKAVAGGWLLCESPRRGALAARYKLMVPEMVRAGFAGRASSSNALSTGGCVTGAIRLAPGHDAFTGRGALKPSCYTVWLCLDEQGALEAKEIAAWTGLHVTTVRTALRVLEDIGVAKPDQRRWVLVGELDLDGVAQRLGTSGRRAARRSEHVQDRIEFGSIEEARRRRARAASGRAVPDGNTGTVGGSEGEIV